MHKEESMTLPRDPLGAFCRDNHIAAEGAGSGPLSGLTFAVKDMFDTADMPTAYGSPIYEGHRPAADAAPGRLAA